MRRFLLAFAFSAVVCSELYGSAVQGKITFLTKRGQHPMAAETLVWLDAIDPKTAAHKATQVGSFQMTTRNKSFLPHVLAIPAGATVTFPNEDPIAHNLFSLTPGNAFDLGLYRRGPGKPHSFTAPGVVNVYCNVHPNMSAVVHVMNTPYYGFADANGAFSVAVPAGKYKLTAWNEQGGMTTSNIEVRADGSVAGATQLTIDGRNFRLTEHTNKNGQPYRAPSEY
jgi:plastocyanin